jgi:hypothetical protein
MNNRVEPDPPEQARYRVGTKLGRTIYRDDELIGVMDRAEDAERIVRLLNAEPDPPEQERCPSRLARQIDRAAQEVRSWPQGLQRAARAPQEGDEGEAHHSTKDTFYRCACDALPHDHAPVQCQVVHELQGALDRAIEERDEARARVKLLPDTEKPNDDTEFAFIDGKPFVTAAKHEQVVDAAIERAEAAERELKQVGGDRWVDLLKTEEVRSRHAYERAETAEAKLESARAALTTLQERVREAARAMSSMPDAGLTNDDPRYDWFFNVLVPARDRLTQALEEEGS